jgi:formamidopyrimidine-DNA glycosylase
MVTFVPKIPVPGRFDRPITPRRFTKNKEPKMPELPEVETIVRQLRESGLILKNPIVKLDLFRPTRWPGIQPEEIAPRLVGRQFTDISRRGKFIILNLDDGAKLVVHLRMTGKLFCSASGDAINKFSREIFHLKDGSSLQFNDPRTLGKLYLLRPGDVLAPLAKMGVEPLSAEFTPEHLQFLLNSCNREIKDFLLDQTKIAGIGNIYASEVLFLCQIQPERRTGALTPPEVIRLHQHIPAILQRSIELKGTTVYDFRTAENKKGSFQLELQVYGRDGKKCFQCGSEIQRIVQKQRSSYFCARCQQ